MVMFYRYECYKWTCLITLLLTACVPGAANRDKKEKQLAEHPKRHQHEKTMLNSLLVSNNIKDDGDKETKPLKMKGDLGGGDDDVMLGDEPQAYYPYDYYYGVDEPAADSMDRPTIVVHSKGSPGGRNNRDNRGYDDRYDPRRYPYRPYRPDPNDCDCCNLTTTTTTTTPPPPIPPSPICGNCSRSCICDGPRGDPGPSVSGPPGLKGYPGIPGLPGGFENEGLRGEPGFLRGLKGFEGDKGQPGPVGPQGPCGPDAAIVGPPGIPGLQGPPGRQGDVGEPSAALDGIPGKKGRMGEHGGDGEQGYKGLIGSPGERGLPGMPGCIGEEGRPGKGHTVEVYVHHFQANEKTSRLVPGRFPCVGIDDAKLWEGYSLLHIEDRGRSLVQDLGQPGSCVPSFDIHSEPLMFCNKDGTCQYKQRTTTTYWLTANHSIIQSTNRTIKLDAPMDYVSRCVVCERKGPILVDHSHSLADESCPYGYRPMWNGYSFLMHAVGVMGGGQPLGSPGSCLQKHQVRMFLECVHFRGPNKARCDFFHDMVGFWLLGFENDRDVPESLKEIDPIPDRNRYTSKCTVCSSI